MAKKMSIREIESGMVLSETVTNANKKVLLSAGTTLTPSLIALLRGAWNIEFVIIAEPGDHIKPIVTKTIISPPESLPVPLRKPLPSKAAKKLFFHNYSSTANHIAQIFETFRDTKKLPFLEVRDAAALVYHSLVETSGSMNYLLLQEHDKGDYLSRHSLAVAVVSGIIGNWLEMPVADIKQVVFAALLHDIGKTTLPLSLQNGKNLTTDTEKNLYCMHPDQGAKILGPLKGVPREVVLAVGQHHEYMDGKGYPNKIKGKSIHIYARIIAIADTFHTMAGESENPNPFAICAKLQQGLIGKLDPVICDTFARRLSDYLFSNDVLLSDGNQAEVIFLQQAESDKPVVRTKDGDFIDLKRRRGLTIQGIIKKRNVDLT